MNDDGTIFFREITLGPDNTPINECDVAVDFHDGHHRLYVLKVDNGFYAHAVEFAGCSSDISDIWQCDQLEVNSLFNVSAYFDGVRHLEFNRDAGDLAGYIYMPNIEAIICMLAKVRELEIEICDE
tara:strand:+ start:108 stop:485 length:378 start_codon:yes stop_codon:yes gene_type:complete